MSASDAQHTMLKNLFAAIDAKDTAAFLEHLATDATFTFGSAPAATGRHQIGDAVEGFFATIKSLSHAVSLVVAEDNVIICEGTVTYTRHNDSSIALPFVDVFNMDAGQIAHYKIYMDVAPLYAE
jgi:ketosteroid isomerase-like protein